VPDAHAHAVRDTVRAAAAETSAPRRPTLSSTPRATQLAFAV
jgi:hypothetical protein